MKALEIEKLEVINGGSCSGAIAQAIGTGIILTAASGGWGIALAVVMAYANAENVSDQCFR